MISGGSGVLGSCTPLSEMAGSERKSAASRRALCSSRSVVFAATAFRVGMALVLPNCLAASMAASRISFSGLVRSARMFESDAGSSFMDHSWRRSVSASMAASRCSSVRVLVTTGAAAMGAGAGGGVTLTAGAGVTDSATGGGEAVFPRCCFKRRAAPNTNAASDNSAKTNFGLMTVSR